MITMLFAYLTSKLLGSPESAALKAAGPLYSFLKAHYYTQEIKKNKSTVQSELRTLDDELMDLRQGIKKENPKCWLPSWNQVGELKRATHKLSSEVSTPDYTKYTSFRERAIAGNKRDNAIKELSNYLEPLRSTVSELKQKPEKFNTIEFEGLRAYISRVSEAYKKLEENFSDTVRDFESKYKNTLIATQCKKKRLSLTQTQKNSNNEPEVDIYLGGVKTKLAHNPPEWNPTGFCLNDSSEWKIKSNGAKKVVGTQSQYFFHNLVISCEYLSFKQLSKLDLNKEVAKATRFTDKYVVKGIVTEEAPRDIVKRVEGFSDPNMAVFLYETDKNKLTYNTSNTAANKFSGYFNPPEKPMGMIDILKSYENNGVIAENDLREKLRLSDSELDKLDLLCVGPGKYSFYDKAVPGIDARIKSRGGTDYGSV